MPLPIGNGTLKNVVALCRACGEACEARLAQSRPGSPVDPAFAATLRCVALLTMIGERLEADEHCPSEIIEATIDLVRELSPDDFGCATACEAAADALQAWLEGDGH